MTHHPKTYQEIMDQAIFEISKDLNTTLTALVSFFNNLELLEKVTIPTVDNLSVQVSNDQPSVWIDCGKYFFVLRTGPVEQVLLYKEHSDTFLDVFQLFPAGTPHHNRVKGFFLQIVRQAKQWHSFNHARTVTQDSLKQWLD